MRSTRFTELAGCTVPIQLAPMGGGIGTLDLAGAVVGAGGHAMLSITGYPQDAALGLIDEAERRGLRTYGLNLLVPFLDREVVEAVASRAPLVDFYLGVPDQELVELAHAGGALVQWQVCSLDEARAAEAAGCDLIVAHSVEAGGRNPGGIGLIPLLEQVLDAVQVPVIAAGGIATGRGIAAALTMGAAGVRLGTRFVATVESGAHAEYAAAILAARAEDSVRTSAFDALWPVPEVAGSRVLRSSMEAVQRGDHPTVGEIELPDGKRAPVARFDPSPPSKRVTGDVAAMPLYAGQSAGMVQVIQPAAEVMAELIEGAEAALRGSAALV
jgi:nitronate monooxygenase